MEFLLDNPESENNFQQLLRLINLRKNGETAALLKSQGIEYPRNMGVPLTELRELAQQYEPDHLLALKLWNKQWRETMILATLLDEPEKVTEEQMDFWTKSFQNHEIAEQASFNLWVKTKFAFAKAIEWGRGKKHLVRFTGIHLMGRLAIVQTSAIDEMFEPFFEELEVLGRDPRLYAVIHRTVIALGTRSRKMNGQALQLADSFRHYEYLNTQKLGETLREELSADYISFRIN
jgi:hypothetical protein